MIRLIHITLLGCVLAGGIAGCCSEIPDSRLKAFAPMARASDLDGTFAGTASTGLHTSLWRSLTGQDAKARDSQMRLTVLDEHTLRVERLVNGVTVERRQMPFRVAGGYVRISYPTCGVGFYDGLLVTGIGCGQAVLTVLSNSHALAVYSDAHTFATVYLIPIPADVFPSWSEFSAAEQGAAARPAEAKP
jgi:hypothetical protein